MASIEHQIENPNISIDEHIAQCCVALARSRQGRAAIYLDFPFWVMIRDVRADLQSKKSGQKLEDLLASFTISGRILCRI